jgi:FkbM family methyltransferase
VLPMPFADTIKTLLNRRGLQSLSVPLMNGLARLQGHGVQRIFVDDGIWMHQTSRGYFAYHQPYLRLDLLRLDEFARQHFLWGYRPKAGDVIMDVGAGVGEETLTFSRAVGEHGKVICIEAHPRTYRCLEKLVRYNRLQNVISIHVAAAEPGCSVVTIEDDNEYLANRLDAAAGVSVPAATIDAIRQKLNLGRVHFLKMNIEGSERLAIHGMAATLKETEILCVSCHDFLAQSAGDEGLRTKGLVRDFLRHNALDVVEREEPGLAPHLRDQVWAYNPRLLQKPAA